ncbi:MAG: flagellar assembly peptidoglycan hydrolase FlgJ [Gammaproteobacteria bacterium]|nr:flagellar assembly peptidoglycan hydrolase FlgJ [Gammaproteobacteria bacterium]
METGSGVYTDFQGLARLRAKAANQSPDALRETAAQFEAIFVQMMLKTMRDASFGGGLMDSKQSDFYREIYDKQIAMDISSKGGLGLGDMLVQQLGGESTDDKNIIGNMMAEMKIDDFLASRKVLSRVSGARITQASAQNQKKNVVQQADRNTDPEFFKDPIDFIKNVWKHAKTAASALGLAPEVLAAQAALETGWGKFLIRDGNGKSSNNLFGVKADKRWDGDSVSVGTLEFRDGVMKKENALFKAYRSIEDSFNDYVDFLKSNPRYQNALENVGDSKSFTRELQSAGYATDPSYAEKINNILNGDVLKQALKALKGFGIQ